MINWFKKLMGIKRSPKVIFTDHHSEGGPWYLDRSLGSARMGLTREDKEFLDSFKSTFEFHDLLMTLPKYEVWNYNLVRMPTLHDRVKYYQKHVTGDGSLKKSLLWYC